MKRIALFCDGTWNSADARFPTNVVRLAQAALHRAPDGTDQRSIYIEGVGSGRGTGEMSRAIDRLGGGAFGWGLTANIEDAYRNLVFAYEPGDEIYIFGFSRGAYTARSLAGMIRATGIIPRTQLAEIPRALERYRSAKDETKPDSEQSFEYRLKISPLVHTSEKERAFRESCGIDPGTRLRVAYLGIWDTVGALGIPSGVPLLPALFNKKYKFHDLVLSSSVAAARHAVAIDEQRSTFTPTLWENIGDLNEGRSGRDRRYQQLWFPGDHGSVGGGGDITGLSAAALLWIAEGAEQKGFAFDPAVLETFAAEVDHGAPLKNSTAPLSVFGKVTRIKRKDRKFVGTTQDLSRPAIERWKILKEEKGWPYRPRPLSTIADAIEEWIQSIGYGIINS